MLVCLGVRACTRRSDSQIEMGNWAATTTTTASAAKTSGVRTQNFPCSNHPVKWKLENKKEKKIPWMKLKAGVFFEVNLGHHRPFYNWVGHSLFVCKLMRIKGKKSSTSRNSCIWSLKFGYPKFVLILLHPYCLDYIFGLYIRKLSVADAFRGGLGLGLGLLQTVSGMSMRTLGPHKEGGL